MKELFLRQSLKAQSAQRNVVLLKMSVAKTKEEQSKFYKSYYILTEEGLLYYNKSKDKLHQLELDGYQLEELRKSFAKDEQIDILSDDQLSEITSITDHLHSSPSMEVHA